jgi:hypothetical protein
VELHVEEEHGSFRIAMAPRKELHFVSHFPIHDCWCSKELANQIVSAVVCQRTLLVRRIRPGGQSNRLAAECLLEPMTKVQQRSGCWQVSTIRTVLVWA